MSWYDKSKTNCWIITIPKTISWQDYEKEIKAVEDKALVMNYRVHNFPKDMRVGDRCYLCHDGKVKGWMEIVGLAVIDKPFVCQTTGLVWREGKYIKRSGKFH